MSTAAFARAPSPPDEGDAAATRVDGAPVAEGLRAVVRALRAHALYNHDNPAYLRAVELAREAGGGSWTGTRELVLTVRESELRWGDAVVHSDGERGGGDALAWMLYKDGMRELTVLPGFEERELVRFLEALHQARRALPDDDDLVTLLWEREFEHLRYRCVQAEDGNAYPAPEDTSGRNVGDAVQAAAASGAANLVRMEDLEGTLYFLEQREIDYLRDELEQEYRTDVRASLVDALLDTFESQRSARVRDEVCAALDALLLQQLVASSFSSAARLLREARVAAERAPDISEAHRDRLRRIGGRLSEPGVLEQLIQAVEGAGETAVADAERLLEELEVSALPTLLRAVVQLERAAVRAVVDRAIARIAAAHTAELVRLVAHEDPVVAIGAVQRSGSLRAAGAVPALAERLGTANVELRQAAAEALAQIGSPGALQVLERVVEDDARGVRLAALRAFASHGYRAALPRLEALVRGRDSRAADLTERMAVFEAYGALCGAGGVDVLDGLLNGRGFLGRRPDPEVRACAAVALGRIGTNEARTALRRAAADREVVVRNAVQRALRGAKE